MSLHATSPYLHLSTSERWCRSGVDSRILTELSLCYSIVYYYNAAQWYDYEHEQFLQVGRLYRALILLGLAIYLPIASVPSVVVVTSFFTFRWAEPGGIGPWPRWLTIVLVLRFMWPVKSSLKCVEWIVEPCCTCTFSCSSRDYNPFLMPTKATCCGPKTSWYFLKYCQIMQYSCNSLGKSEVINLILL